MKRNLERLRRHAIRLFAKGPMILMYHHVGDAAPGDPWQLAVSPAHFREQLSVLRRHRTPMGLAELMHRHASGPLPKDAVAITFDDGYASNLHFAKPALEEFGIPATVFVTSEFIDRQDEPWWDELAALLLAPTSLPDVLHMKLDGRVRDWRQRHWSRRHRLQVHHEIHRWLVRQREPEQRSALAMLRGQIIGLPQAGGGRRTLSAQELCTLADSGVIEIGAHTVTHPSLPRLSLGLQRDEIAGSKSALEAVLDRPVMGFAYPYGDYDEVSLDTVAECGFHYACSSTRGFVHASDSALRLPRIMVQDWDGENFARRMTPSSSRLVRFLPRWRSTAKLPVGHS